MCFYYALGFFLNTIANLILKGIFQQARPDDDPKQFYIMNKYAKLQLFKDTGIPFNIYGMPSGHLQSCLFSATFVFLVLKKIKILLFFLFISMFSVVQRIQTSSHTLFQTIVGGMCGVLFGTITFYLSSEKLKGKIHEKPDDYGPI